MEQTTNTSALAAQIDDLFADAVELPAQGRESFVRARSAGNERLQNAVLDLLHAFDSGDDFLHVETAVRPRLIGQCAVGDRIEAFEIKELLGAGGMGEVYLAFDHNSEELVALKFIQIDEQERSGNEARLKREARVRGLAHPNICPVYSLHQVEREGRRLAFLCMKYLDGVTLADLMAKGGVWEVAEALPILKGVGAGLDAAHEQGVVHRDLKPRNIMIISGANGQQMPVILDFGLVQELQAPLANRESGQTRLDVLVGSPAYMAPEQFLSSTVTSAADIYALGMIACELISGRRPFPEENILQAAVRRQKVPSAELSELLSKAPRNWQDTIAKALHPDPAQRLQTARAFIGGLEARETPKLPFNGRVSRRQVVGIIGTAIGMSLFGAFYRFKDRWQIPNKPSMLMLTPVTSSGSSNLAEASRIATLLLATQMKQSSWVAVLDSGRMSAAWQRMRKPSDPGEMPAELKVSEARQIALRSNCHEVLYASLAQTGAETVLRLNVEFLGNSLNTNVEAKSAEFVLKNVRDLPDAAGEAARWVRATLGESRESIANHDFRAEDLTTPSWEALRAYTTADTAWRRSQNADVAVLNLKNALAIDPEFPAAGIRLADILMANHQPDEAYAQYDKAVKVLTARNLTDRESFRARGLFQLDVGLCQEAADTFSRFAAEYPADPIPLFYRASALNRLEHVEAAEELYTKALTMAPDAYYIHFGRARLYLWANRLAEAERDCETGRRLKDGGWADQTKAAIAMARGDLAGARVAILRLRKDENLDFQSKSYALEACWFAEQGRFEEAEQALRAGLGFDLKNEIPVSNWLTKQRLLGQEYIRQGKKREALCACGEVLRRTTGTEVTLQAAGLLAQLGEVRLAELAFCDPKAAVAQLGSGCAAQRGLAPVAGPLAGKTAPCVPAALPAWPIYTYWRQRLDIEIAVSRGEVNSAEELTRLVPADAAYDTAPDYLLRVARARKVNAKEIAANLMKTPGRWWFEPERNPPGFLASLRQK